MELVREDGSAKVIKLAKTIKLSEATIPQDLERLEQEGFILREHGGAFLKTVEDSIKSITLLNQENLEKKQLIGRKASELVETGDTIILDSGSTTTEIAKNLIGRKGPTVIPNGLNIALILDAEPGIELIVTDGEFKPPTLSLTGQKAADFLEDIHVDKLFLAKAGISLRSGLTYPSLSDMVVKKALIDAADTAYLVADSIKIDKNAFAGLGAFSLIDSIITDASIDQTKAEILCYHEIEFIIAD